MRFKWDSEFFAMVGIKVVREGSVNKLEIESVADRVGST